MTDKIIVVDGIAFASRDGRLESLTPGECGKVIERLQIDLYDARGSIYRVCHALSGSCVMVLKSPQHDTCTPENCLAMSAAALPAHNQKENEPGETQTFITALDLLIQATEHLLNNYGLDAPGSEVYRHSVEIGKEWLDDLKNLTALSE